MWDAIVEWIRATAHFLIRIGTGVWLLYRMVAEDFFGMEL